jgi:DNA-directed RNA polymerase beta subunit
LSMQVQSFGEQQHFYRQLGHINRLKALGHGRCVER